MTEQTLPMVHPNTGRAFDDRFDTAYGCGCVEFYDALIACAAHPAGPLVAEMIALDVASKLVYVGVVMEILPIANADRLERAHVDCGAGGQWWGVVGKGDFVAGARAIVYLADSVLPPEPQFEFMRKYKYRVRMQKLRGVPSEVLIMPVPNGGEGLAGVGDDVTEYMQVHKYEKPQPNDGSGPRRKRYFPPFIPKTDEPNFQRARDLVDILRTGPCYVTEKADGSSMTVYKHNGVFGVCARNIELFPLPSDRYWQVVLAYRLDTKLPEGFAIQAELVGPSVQGNPLGLAALDMRVFNVYQIGRGYMDFADAWIFAEALDVPFVNVLDVSYKIPDTDDALRVFAEGVYPNGQPREGIVIRPLVEAQHCGERVSVKVLNLNYKD